MATIFIMSSDEKARSDSVRMLPSAPRLKLSAVAESSSGASTTVTMSYRPCVQNISFTVTPNVFAICLKASARFGEVFSVLDALIGERGKYDIGHHDRSPWLLLPDNYRAGPTEGSLEDFMPKLDGILETAIHTEDMVRARAFYEGVLGLEPIFSDSRLSAYAVAGRNVLLVFRKGTTGQTVVLPSGTIPGHGGDACCMWRSPLARTNSIVGRNISFPTESPSKDATIGSAGGAASISAIRTVTFWNWQRRDCGPSTSHSGSRTTDPDRRCPLCPRKQTCAVQLRMSAKGQKRTFHE